MLQELLYQRLSGDWKRVYAQVAQLITHTVRASSAVECLNSVLRMHQNRHRYVSQEMLDLKRLFWNCRRFTHGKRRGATAACEQISAALGLFRPDGGLSDRSWAQHEIDAALVILSGQEWDKARRLLHDPRTLSHLDGLHEGLEQVVAKPQLREALCRLWYWRSQLGHLQGL